MRSILILMLSLLSIGVWGQMSSQQPPATSAADRVASFEQRKALEQNSIVNNIPFRNVGPSVFSGRVVDVAVWDKDPSHFYVAYASGGLWKTENNGITFEPLFDNEMVMTTGAVAADWDNNTVWLGTGEVNSSRSSYAGVGVYKSSDGGKNWQHMGLDDSHHIGRILIHPKDPNTVFVAALGHLYSSNEERGVFKTSNGGKTWEKVLYVNDNAGAVDLIFDPKNPNTIYAATWERTRRAWDFLESGNGSAIYKSTDNGKTWKRVSTEKSGFPADSGTGRIGLTATVKNGKTLLYAALDNYNRRPKEDKDPSDDLTKDDLRDMSKEDFLKLDRTKVAKYLRNNRFPRKYNVNTVVKMVKSDEIKPLALVEYIENANSLLFDTPVIGLEIYVSDNGGKSWTKTHDDYIDAVYSSYGYYFGNIRVATYDPNKLFVLGVPVIRSDDGGKTWKSVGGPNVHSDHHALWINPNRPGHLILGNDGGINISYDDGENWNKCNSPALGQFYYIAVDMETPYNVYGGLQDNGVWFGPSTYQASARWQGSGQYPYRGIYGGDGMQVAVDTRDNETVYTGSQFGFYSRLNTRTRDRKMITPRHELGDRPLRWNWQTPIHLSEHNQDIFYMASNKLHRSFDQGNSFEEISGDLTNGGIKGDVPFGTLATIHESPLQFGLLYTGSDDGLIHITKDGGNSWDLITDGLPKDMWVSRVIASSFKKERVYAVMNGYRWDDFNAYVFVSENYGQDWTRIGKDLPLEPANVIKEDTDNENILYVGTDHGLYVSLDRGESFMLLNNGLPAVPVHDVVIHPREKDIVVGTHGRSIYIGPGKELQQLTNDLMAKNIHVFGVKGMRSSPFWGRKRANWSTVFSAPTLDIPAYVKNAGKATVEIKMGKDLVLNTMELDTKKGLNYLSYDLSVNPDMKEEYQKMLNTKKRKGSPAIELKAADNDILYLKGGTYTIAVTKDGETAETTFELK